MGWSRGVRNFWVDAIVDGRKTDVGFGPVSHDGGFHMEIRIKEEGDISEKRIIIDGNNPYDDLLELSIRYKEYGSSVELFKIITNRDRKK